MKKKLETIKEMIDKLKPNDSKGKVAIQMMIKNVFFLVFIEIFYDYTNYLTVIDGYPIFNTNEYIQNRPEKDSAFYKEITETQIFMMFIQNVIKDENTSLFNKKINQCHSPASMDPIYNKIQKEFLEIYESKTKIDKTFYVKPHFLNLPDHPTKKEIIQLNLSRYFVDFNSQNCEKGHVVSNLIPLTNTEFKKFYSFNHIPNTEILTKEPTVIKESKVLNRIKHFEKGVMKNKMIKNFIFAKGKNAFALTEEEKEEIKDNMKETLLRALKSEALKLPEEKNHLVTAIESSFGQDFFINAIYLKPKAKESNLKIIGDQCYQLLSDVFFAFLLEILKEEENQKCYRKAILLIKSSMSYYKVESNIKVFLKQAIIPQLKDYCLLLKLPFWEEWINIELNEKPDIETIKKNQDLLSNSICSILLQITMLMIEIDIQKDVIYQIISDLAAKHLIDEAQRKSILAKSEQLIRKQLSWELI